LALAKPLYQEVIDGQTAHYGESHPKTLLSKGNYASLLVKEGTAESLALAKEEFRLVVAGFEAQLPASHPWLVWAKARLHSLE
jgi:hypothetical protein